MFDLQVGKIIKDRAVYVKRQSAPNPAHLPIRETSSASHKRLQTGAFFCYNRVVCCSRATIGIDPLYLNLPLCNLRSTP